MKGIRKYRQTKADERVVIIDDGKSRIINEIGTRMNTEKHGFKIKKP